MNSEDSQQLQAYISSIKAESLALDSMEAFEHSVCQQILLNFAIRKWNKLLEQYDRDNPFFFREK